MPTRGVIPTAGTRLRGRAGRIAGLENLELLLSQRRGAFDFFLPREVAGARLVAASAAADRVTWLTLRRTTRSFLHDWTVVHQSDLTDQLHRAGIDLLIPSYRSSPRLERWARQQRITLLTPPWRLQRLLENKVSFDAMLHRWGLPAPRHRLILSPTDFERVPGYPLVLQSARGEGSTGTHLVRSRAELRELLATHPFRYPLLAREFVRGASFGVTIIVGEHDSMLSAIRAQSVDLEHRETGFLATQWCARRSFSTRLLETMSSVFGAAGAALRSVGFRGAAGLDFLVDGDRVLIIECNPRFTAATPQLSLEPSLLHGRHFATEYVRAVTGQRLSAAPAAVPESSYEGACVDFSAWVVPQVLPPPQRGRVFAMPRIGIYDVASGTLEFVSEDLATLRGDSRLLFHYSTRLGARIGPRADLGSLLSNFPIFDFTDGTARLTERSKQLLTQLRGEVQTRRPRSRRAAGDPPPPAVSPPVGPPPRECPE